MDDQQDADGIRMSAWSARYGERHRLQRIVDFPVGIAAPRKVRIYERAGHYVLQAWDPSLKATLSDRVDGDLLAALMRAREIDERLVQFRRSGKPASRLTPAHFVERFLQDLEQRCDAGEIAPATVARYRHALRYYLDFVARPEQALYTNVARTDRPFQRAFAAALKTATVRPRMPVPPTRRRLLASDYILDVVRALFCWGADPARGGLLGDGFLNPFLRQGRSRSRARREPTLDPSITIPMACGLLTECDPWQLPIFAGLTLWGLRPSELCWLLTDDISPEWVTVRCRPELDYQTKGGTDKRLPLLPDHTLWTHPSAEARAFLFGRRPEEKAPPRRTSRALLEEYQQQTAGMVSARSRLAIRTQLHRAWGGLSYDALDGEFRRLTQRLDWPPSATLKGFRHLFATCLENGGMPEFYRRYLMGHSSGRSAIVTYTHLNQLRQQYERVVRTELGPVLEALHARTRVLSQG